MLSESYQSFEKATKNDVNRHKLYCYYKKKLVSSTDRWKWGQEITLCVQLLKKVVD